MLRSSTVSRFSTIEGLLASCSPSTVLGGIVSVVIDSIKRVLRGSFPHIFIKGFKRIEPSFTKLYTSAPIIAVGMISFIVASIFGILPCFKFWRFTHSMRKSKFSHSCSLFFQILFPQTTTAFSLICFKVVSFYNFLFPTSAKTFPNRIVIFVSFDKFKCCQSIKFLITNVFYSHLVMIPQNKRYSIQIICLI